MDANVGSGGVVVENLAHAADPEKINVEKIIPRRCELYLRYIRRRTTAA